MAGLILAQAGLLAHALASAAPGGGVGALRATLTGLVIVVIGRAIAGSGAEVAALRTAAEVKHRLRSRLIRHCAALGPAWLGEQRAGELATLATGGLDALDPYFARYLPQAALAVIVPGAVLVAVTAQDWISGVIIALTLPLVPLFAVLVGLHTKARTHRSWQMLAKLSGHFLDVVQGLPTLKVFGRAQAQAQVIDRVTGDYRRSVMTTLRVAFLSSLVLELAAALATALVAVEVGIRLLYGHLGYQTALFVLLLTPEAYLPLRNASAAFHAGADGTAVARKAFAVLDTPAPANSPRAHRQVPRQVRPDLRSLPISLSGITVAYPGRPEPVLHRVNLTINPGERIMIKGPNGSGKSSLLGLLLRFVEPADGRILVGQADLAEIAADLWRGQIGWMPQHPALFPWSVAENIAIGAPGAGRAAIERAACLAGADDFIGELPGGYDAVLDERGLRLSAGQRQKIALARLFLRDAPLILADEPTAHLDQASAAAVNIALATLTATRTVIVVTNQADFFPASRPPPTQPSPPSRTLVVAHAHITESAALTGAPAC